MWKYLFSLLDSDNGLQFNTLDGTLANKMWFEHPTACHLIHREWGGPLPVLGEWVPSTIEIYEEVPDNGIADGGRLSSPKIVQDIFGPYAEGEGYVSPEFLNFYPEDHVSWKDEEMDVQLESDLNDFDVYLREKYL